MYMYDDKEEREEERDGRRTGCIQNENPHIGEWWEKRIPWKFFEFSGSQGPAHPDRRKNRTPKRRAPKNLNPQAPSAEKPEPPGAERQKNRNPEAPSVEKSEPPGAGRNGVPPVRAEPFRVRYNSL